MIRQSNRGGTTTVNGDLRKPGFWEGLRELLLGTPKPLDCVQVEITTRCDLRCSYCPQTVLREHWRAANMRWETFARLWPLMRRCHRIHLQGWGEPLLHPDFFRMIKLAREAGCAVSTTTSAMPMSEAVARKLVESGVDIVAVSLAGTDAVSNGLRQGAPFERVCRAIERLQAIRQACQGVHLEVHIAYLMPASTMAAVSRLPSLMQRLGVHAAVISTLDFTPSPALEAEAFGLHETAKLEQAAALLFAAAGEARRLGMQFHYALPDPAAPGQRCRENIARSLFVAVDGSVSPCVFTNLPIRGEAHPRRVFGNVDQEAPLVIWEGDRFRQFRQNLAAGRPDAVCQRCPKRYEAAG